MSLVHLPNWPSDTGATLKAIRILTNLDQKVSFPFIVLQSFPSIVLESFPVLSIGEIFNISEMVKCLCSGFQYVQVCVKWGKLHTQDRHR